MEVWSTVWRDEEVPNAVMPPPAFHVAHKDECSRSFPLASRTIYEKLKKCLKITQKCVLIKACAYSAYIFKLMLLRHVQIYK